MKLKIFWQEDCPHCPAAKRLGEALEAEGVEVLYYDVKTLEGLTEASFYSVFSTPGIIIVNDEEEEVAGWRGATPNKEEIYRYLQESE